MKHSIKLTAIAFFTCLITSITKTNAQSYPQWDNLPDADLSSGNGPSIYLRGCSGNGTDVYFLTGAGGVHIYRWSEANGWQCIGNTFNGNEVNCITIQGHFLFVGGYFSSMYDGNGDNPTNVTNIAKFDLNDQKWSSVGSNNLTLVPQSIAVDSATNIYVGCWDFGEVCGNLSDGCSCLATNMLVKFNGIKWDTVGGGLQMGKMNCPDTNYYTFEPQVSALTTDGTNIFAAGGFIGAWQTNGTYVPSHGIIKWDGTQWVQMGMNESPIFSQYTGIFRYATDMTGYEPLDDPYCMSVVGTNLFVAGNFTIPHPLIARFSTVSGAALPCNDLLLNGDTPHETSIPKLGFVTHDGMIYLAGNFDHVGSVAANGIACWNNDGSASGSWTNLGTGLTRSGTNAIWGYVNIAANSNAVFVASDVYVLAFDSAGGVDITNAPSVARWMTGPDPGTVSFTSGNISSLDLWNVNTFTFTVTGTPRIVWTVYGCWCPPSWEAIGTIQIGNDGTASFTDYNAGSQYWPQQFYQLCRGDQQSDIFGYDLVQIPSDAYNAYLVTNPMASLAPGTLNSAFNANNVVWDSSGNPLSSEAEGSLFVDITGDPYDHTWNGSSWIPPGSSYFQYYGYWGGPALSGDQIPFGYGDTIWLYGFQNTTVGFIGILPPGTYGLY